MKKLLFLVLILMLFSALLVGCTGGGDVEEPVIIQINVDGFGNNVFYQLDDLDLENVKLILTYANGKASSIPATADMVSGFNSQEVGKQTVVFTYKGLKTSVEIEIKGATAVAIDVTKRPEKLSFIQGTKNLDLSTVEVSLIFSNDRQVALTEITQQMISGYNPQGIGKQIITISYGGLSTTLEIEIIQKNISSIEVSKTPNVTTYYKSANGTLDNTGLIVLFKYDNKETESLSYEQLKSRYSETELVFIYDLSRPTNKTFVYIELRLEGKEVLKTKYDIMVSDLVYKSMKIIKAPISNKLVIGGQLQEYRNADNLVEGLGLDWSTGIVQITFNDDSTIELPTNSPYIKALDYDPNSVRNSTVMITYAGNPNWAVPMSMVVNAKSGHSVEFDNMQLINGEDVKYYPGDKVSLLNLLTYTITYNNGTVSEKKLYDNSLLAPDSTLICEKEGKKTINLRIAGLTIPIELMVSEITATSLVIKAPTRNEQKKGITNLDLSGSNYAAGLSNKNVVGGILEASMLTYFLNGVEVSNFSEVGTYTVVVTYLNKTANFEIKIVETIISEIIITTELTKNKFFLSEFTTLNEWYEEFAKIKFKTEDETGKKENDIAITSDMVYKFNRYKIGKQNIEFRYRGYIFAYPIEIVALEEVNIDVKILPRVLFAINDVFECNGLAIEKIFNDGNSDFVYDISVNEKFIVIAPDMTTDGKKTVTIRYTTDYGTVLETEYEILVAMLTIDKIVVDETQELFKDYDDNSITKKVLEVVKGQPLNLYGLYLKVIYNELDEYGNPQTANIQLINTTNNYEPNVELVGQPVRSVRISYNGKETYINILIIDKTLESISVTKKPTRTMYAEGQSLSFDGGELTITYSGGKTEIISLTNRNIILKSYNANPFLINAAPGETFQNPVIIEYKGMTASFDVITVKRMKATLSYQNIIGFYGEELKPSVSIVGLPQYFEVPQMKMEYFVNNLWTATVPRLPAEYQIRVTVIENNFYIGCEIQESKLQVVKKSVNVAIFTEVKSYKDRDPEFEAKVDGLVGKDKLGYRLFREDKSENVKYDMANAIIGYDISAELLPSFGADINQNDYYIITFSKATLTINPIETSDVRFSQTQITYNGQLNHINAECIIGGNSRAIEANDILYYTESNELIEAGGVTDIGTYKAVISKNYKVNGINHAVVTVF